MALEKAGPKTSKIRVLVVEDDKKLAEFIGRTLIEDGYAVDVCHDGSDGWERASAVDYDGIVLDILLPGVNGLDVLRNLRRQGRKMPVLVLSVRGTVQDRVQGLDSGADDYLAKPFALEELRARLRALLRRGGSAATTVLTCGDLKVNLVDRSVRRGPREIGLTPREFSLLEYFLRNAGRVLTRTSIAEQVWDYNFDCQSNVVDVFVGTLRRKLEEGGESRLIHTLRGIGYEIRES